MTAAGAGRHGLRVTAGSGRHGLRVTAGSGRHGLRVTAGSGRHGLPVAAGSGSASASRGRRIGCPPWPPVQAGAWTGGGL